MKKTIITLVALGAVVGGGFLYKASRDAKNNPIITIQGVDTLGTQQKIVFTNEGCTYAGEQGRTIAGTATSQDFQNTCQPGQGTNLSQAQFECGLNLCQGGGNPPGQLKVCSVNYTSSTGTCNVSGCGSVANGSYAISSSEYIHALNSWGMDSVGLAHACANIIVTPEEEPFSLEKEENNTSATTSTPTPTKTNTSR